LATTRHSSSHINDETEQLRFNDHHQTQVSRQAIAKSHIEQLRLRDLLSLIQDHSHVATPHNCSYIQDTQRSQKVFAFGGILGRKAASSRMDTQYGGLASVGRGSAG
jgi:hypothetical protein